MVSNSTNQGRPSANWNNCSKLDPVLNTPPHISLKYKVCQTHCWENRYLKITKKQENSLGRSLTKLSLIRFNAQFAFYIRIWKWWKYTVKKMRGNKTKAKRNKNEPEKVLRNLAHTVASDRLWLSSGNGAHKLYQNSCIEQTMHVGNRTHKLLGTVCMLVSELPYDNCYNGSIVFLL
jgi:hypothetical protein